MIAGGAPAPQRAIADRAALVPTAVVLAALSGCDRNVPLSNGLDAARADAVTTTYQGTLMKTPATAFGGDPYCKYTITLEQIEIELQILSGGAVASGRVQNLNVEATEASCPHSVKPTSVARYTLRAAASNGADMQLTFEGASTNDPAASLVVELSPVETAYSAVLTFHRIDFSPPLDWLVMATVPLHLQLSP